MAKKTIKALEEELLRTRIQLAQQEVKVEELKERLKFYTSRENSLATMTIGFERMSDALSHVMLAMMKGR